MSAPEIRVCGLSKDVTLAILPRLYLEEVLLELSRRNISTEYSSREHLVTLLRDVMEYEYRNSNSDSVQKAVEVSVYRRQGTHLPMPSKYQMENTIHRPQQFENEATFPSAYAQTMSSIWSPPAPVTAYNSTSTENAAEKSMRGEYTNFSIFPTFTATHKPALSCKTQPNINTTTEQVCQTEVVLVQGSPSNEEDDGWDVQETNVADQLSPVPTNTMAVDKEKSAVSNSEETKELKQERDGNITSEDVKVLNEKPCETPSISGRRRRARKSTPTKRETRKRRKKSKHEEACSSDEDPDVTVTPILIRKSSLEGFADDEDGDLTLYHCPQCEYTSRVKVNMQHHIRTHTGEKPFKCSECDYSASQKVHLDTHMTRHTGERSYMCEECGHRTAFRCNLVRHLRTHTGEKPYKCDLCSYRAIRRTHLVNHMRTHTGEKPFMCEECGHMTTDKTSLIRHKKNHTDRN